ncbi:hypothetical protein HYX16_05540 [Candidatus Woesearchaeota archaeon]|nr:hypothetical protein [Candidatus Woesearchaeota archaeon]
MLKDSQEIFKEGSEVFYYEGGDIYKVLVMENRCDNNKLEYKLRVLGLEQDIFEGKIHLENGLEFACYKVRDYPNIPLIWTIAAGKKRLIKKLRKQGFNI